MSAKKKPTKKTPAKKGKDDVIIAVRYGVTVPERDLIDLLRLDCSKKIKEFCSKVEAEMPKAMKEVFSVASGILGIIQDAWKDAIKFNSGEKNESARAKTDKQPKSGTLSEKEKVAIRILRMQGRTIKAISKEIHRSDKVVAPFVKTLPALNK